MSAAAIGHIIQWALQGGGSHILPNTFNHIGVITDT